MLRIRAFEEAVRELVQTQQLPGFVHLSSGQEATAVGICTALRDGDRVTSTHRGHGHALAKGCDPARVMAELMGRTGGYSAGKGGSMHIVSLEHGVLGTNGIVGGGIPIALGASLASSIASDGSVAVTFFGDGAANQGVLFESLNMAAVWKLPIVFVCENNGYAEWSPSSLLTAGRIADRGRPFGIPSIEVDGNDVLAVTGTGSEAVERARAGLGPSLIEAVTYRTEGHLVGEEALVGRYRAEEEIARWRDADPIARFSAWLERNEIVEPGEIAEVRLGVDREIQAATQAAAASPRPAPEDATRDVFRCAER
jgi:pyruvate dehydrogenase E1 component alpha subunit